MQNVKLPRMTKGEDVEIFIELFEAALLDNDIDDGSGKANYIRHLTQLPS